jgi:hypothetical protein
MVYPSRDFNEIKAALKERLTVEGRKIFNPDEMKELAIKNHGVRKSCKRATFVERK